MTRCWWCSVEPLEAHDVSTLRDLARGQRHFVYDWPPGDHDHAVTPPTPNELAAAGDRASRSIIREWCR